ncbi:MAG: hypothetical protein GBAus27B_000608 [Mycoplasmataceae bacterium]|nr:MAG: hypothetical protein GBAus27B_000608 [Mycoplasmataceae bacterium]
MNKEKKIKIQSTDEWAKLKNRKKTMPEPPKEASSNLRQIEIPYARTYRPRLTKRTGRVIQFATRVTAEFDNWIRGTVQKENIHLAEMLERMMMVYQKEASNYNFVSNSNNINKSLIRERESKIGKLSNK